jgi:hypothetical protein
MQFMGPVRVEMVQALHQLVHLIVLGVSSAPAPLCFSFRPMAMFSSSIQKLSVSSPPPRPSALTAPSASPGL